MKTDLFDYSKQHWLWIQHTSGAECNISEIFQIEGGLAFKDIWWRRPEEQPMHIIRGAIKRYNVEPDTWIVLMDADPGGIAFIRRLTRSKKLLWDEQKCLGRGKEFSCIEMEPLHWEPSRFL